DVHARATDYALARLLFGRVLPGVAELWLAALLACLEHEDARAEGAAYLHSEQNAPVLAALRAHLTWRLRTRRARLTLSGLGTVAPVVAAPAHVAVWYCAAASPRLAARRFTAGGLAVADRLRDLGHAARHLVRLLAADMLALPHDAAWTRHRMALYAAMAWLTHDAKGARTQHALLRAQYQRSCRVSVAASGQGGADAAVRVFLDGGATAGTRPALPRALAALTLGEVLYLSARVNVRLPNNGVLLAEELGATAREL